MLRTRNREKRLLEFCFMTSMPVVIDNTNVSTEDRELYLKLAKEAGFKVYGYFFQPDVKRSIRLNNLRQGKEKVSDVAIFSKKKKLELPSFEEGFDALYSVHMEESFAFKVEEWGRDH